MTIKEVSNELFNKVVEASPSAMIMVDKSGTIILVNLQTETLFGYSRIELLGSPVEILIPKRYQSSHPLQRNKYFMAPSSRAMGSGRELYGLRKDGSEVPIEIGLNPLEIEQQTYVLASVIDITERKKADDRFRLAVEAAPNAMLMVDHTGTIVMANKQSEELFKYTREELLGRAIELLVPERFREQHPQLRASFLKEPRIRAMGAGRDLYGRTSTGDEVPIVIGLTPIGSAPNILVLASIIDISERKRNEQLLASREAALQASQIKSQFLATMSHEIRTPLNGIVGLTNLLSRTHMNVEQKEFLQGIRVSADSLLSLINDILDFSKIEAGKMDFEVINFNLGQLLTDMISVNTSAAREKNLSLQVDIASDLPQWFKGDASKLRQILINLLGNAIKFTHQGGVTIRVLKSAAHPKHVTFEVEDTGIGMTEEIVDRLFVVFTQGDSSTSRKYGGTGLGLSICKLLTEKMGGQIGVRSNPNSGSCFWFYLPLEVGEEVSEPRPRIEESQILPLAGKRVLVAEDNIINQKVALGILKNLGIQGQAVANGSEAIEVINKFGFDAILMDCHMPEMDGYEATQRIRRVSDPQIANIPIIAMTANAMKGDKEKCLAAGMNDYITKPVTVEQTERILRQWLLQKPLKGTITSDTPTSDYESLKQALDKLNSDHGLEMAKEIVGLFLSMTPETFDKLQEYVEKNEFDKVLMQAHTYKSTSKLLGLNQLAFLAETIESMCRQKSSEGIEEHIQRMRGSFAEIKDVLVGYISG